MKLQRHFQNSERGVYAASIPNTKLEIVELQNPRSIRALKRRKRRAPNRQRKVAL